MSLKCIVIHISSSLLFFFPVSFHQNFLFIYETNLQKEEEVSSRDGFEMGYSDALERRCSDRNRYHMGHALFMGAVEP